jgi:predicted Zn-dependent protease
MAIRETWTAGAARDTGEIGFASSGGARSAAGGRARVAGVIAALLAFVPATAWQSPATAQSISFIRDAEIEQTLADYARPILAAAGLGSQRIKVRIVKNRSFNAFVLDGRNIFINTGTLMQAETPNEVIGIIAHETGHIAGGHLANLRRKIEKDVTRNLLMKVLGIGAMIAGATAGSDEVTGVGQGVITGADAVTMRSILSYQRVHEGAADQAAVKFLTATKQSARGMLDTFQRFAEQEMFSDQHKDPYIVSHPMAQDRLNQLQQLAERSPYYSTSDPPELQLRHDLMRAKLTGYLFAQSVPGRYPASDQTLPARYARAIAAFNTSGAAAALPLVDDLIAARPDYPYFHEFKGDILFRSGKPAEAIAPYSKALKLAGGKSNLIRIALAQSILNAGDRSRTDDAIELLRVALVDEDNAQGYGQLANAYFQRGDEGLALLATAQQRLIEGNIREAQAMAKRAQPHFTSGSPSWVKADDIINMHVPAN